MVIMQKLAMDFYFLVLFPLNKCFDRCLLSCCVFAIIATDI